jgi:cytochrome c peroxidase
VEAFGESLLARLTQLEARKALKFHSGFSREAYSGLRVFFQTTGEARTGNCVACHVPPLFTDGAFHNAGIAQAEYDAVHGSGSFAQLAVPNASGARRPVARFGPKTERGRQVNADLGYWNFAPRPEAAPERKDGGSFLSAAFGAFKTPTLRNLKYTDPYMHNGAYRTLEEAVTQKVKACALARSGALRNGDKALSVMKITEEDIAPLVAFLTTLNDVPVEEFEAYRRSEK